MNKMEQWLQLDAKLNELRDEKRKAVSLIEAKIAELDAERAGLISMIEEEMRKNGVLEDIYEGKYSNYKICYQKQPEKPAIIDANAIPDELCKIERKPIMKDVKEYLQNVGNTNWGRMERGEPKLTYRMVKK